jgi:hypothetical protein
MQMNKERAILISSLVCRVANITKNDQPSAHVVVANSSNYGLCPSQQR